MNSKKAARVERANARTAADLARYERIANHTGSVALIGGGNAAVYERASLLVGEGEWGVRFEVDNALAARIGVTAPLLVIVVFDESNERVSEHVVKSLN